MALKNNVVSDMPKKKIKLDGKTYEMELGNFTFAIDAQEWVEQIQSLSGGEKALGELKELSSKAHSMIASILGEDAAEELVGGQNRLNIYKIVRLLGILAEEIISQDAFDSLASAITAENETLDN
ncbi:MAG: hypothetical protein ACFNX8_00065 [Lancefieldella rimae]